MATNTLRPLTVYGHWGAPNPIKIRIILDELDIPYDWRIVEITDVKSETFTKINVNGRVPAIVDPNTGITLWESGAIILYLIEEYDKKGKLSYGTSSEKYLLQQWLMFQVSGQGPYFGQAVWFARYHQEKIPSAITRYADEIERVASVLDTHLANTKQAYLVGEKCTYADLSFVPWANLAKGLLKELGQEKRLDKFTQYNEWLGRLNSREVVKHLNAQVEKGRKEHGMN
ncbi:Glutathione S-transferase, domain-containing protein [Cladophialophora immunda]|nr:Glutathione S-transferase, domain-containing protein [Cladophialophora immunda]